MKNLFSVLLVLRFCFRAAIAAVALASTLHAQQAKVQLEERAHPISVTFGADSDHVLTGSDGYFQLWDWRQEKAVGPRFLVNRKYAKDSTKSVLRGSLRFSRDGRFVASCRDRKDTDANMGDLMLAQVWDLRSGKTAAELPRPASLEECHALDFSPDGTTLAMVVKQYAVSNSVVFFDTQTWKQRHRSDLGADTTLHDQLRYSPSGDVLVVWATDERAPPGMSRAEYNKAQGATAFQFFDTRIEAIVLQASDGQALARKILHWVSRRPNAPQITSGFDASGDRVLSAFPFGGVIEQYQEAIYVNCPTYEPRSIPEGFEAKDLCRKHKAVQVWHWRTGKVETVFEYPAYVRSTYAVESPEQRLWTTLQMPQFTADGRFLVLMREDVDKAEYNPNSTGYVGTHTLEIRDAQTYEVLLTREFARSGNSTNGPFLSPDGRYMALVTRQGRKHGGAVATYLYEIQSK